MIRLISSNSTENATPRVDTGEGKSGEDVRIRHENKSQTPQGNDKHIERKR